VTCSSLALISAFSSRVHCSNWMTGHPSRATYCIVLYVLPVPNGNKNETERNETTQHGTQLGLENWKGFRLAKGWSVMH
jgi:hypothetical protein